MNRETRELLIKVKYHTHEMSRLADLLMTQGEAGTLCWSTREKLSKSRRALAMVFDRLRVIFVI